MTISDKVIAALRWAAVARFGAQLMSWAVTVCVIRILTPEDFGMTAMIAVVTSFLVLINCLGLDAVLVQRELGDVQRRKVFGVIVTVNLLFFALLQLGASTIASFYDEPRLTPLIRVLAFQFVILIFETLPQARLERELRFQGRSIIELTAAMVASLGTLGMALAGFGVWALVWGSMLMTATRTLGLCVVSPSNVWPSFSFSGLREFLAFGSHVSADRGLWCIYSESDKFIGGKVMGTGPLGVYAVATHLASLPIHKVMGVINAVAFPAFAQASATSDRVGEYLIKATRVLSLLAFPVFFGMSAVAPELVWLLLGERWIGAIVPLQLLTLIMPLRMLGNVFSPLLFGIGRPDISARNNLIAAVSLPVVLFVGARYGTTGLSLAWVLGFPGVFLVFVATSCRLVGVPLTTYFRQLVRPVLYSSLMWAVVTLARPWVPGDPGDVVHLAQLVAVGVVAYAAALYLFHRDGLDLLRELTLRGLTADRRTPRRDLRDARPARLATSAPDSQ